MNIKKSFKILGIETSCDETAAAVLDNDLNILSNVVSSQIDLHKKYGGVYPELASRAHLENIIPVIKEALNQAKLSWQDIDAIAVTSGPGLIGSLLIGVETAKTLSYAYKKPLIPINHLEGHICANFIGTKVKSNNIEFPILNLIVSGGHTSLVLFCPKGAPSGGKYKTVGETRDDAAGEAFDKVAQLLGLTYPGGPAIEKAVQNSVSVSNLKTSLKLPRPMIDSANFDFSFSGLKTAVLRLTKELGPVKTKKFRNEIAAEFQKAVCDVLINKTLRAAQKYKVKTIMLSGGVAANAKLREEFKTQISVSNFNTDLLVPPKNLCTDNAAMIAAAGVFRFTKNGKQNWSKTQANPNLELS